jgi:phosphohistidine swiveling domain-containing protein
LKTIKYNNTFYDQEFLEYHTPFWISLWLNDNFAKAFTRLTGVDVGSISMLVNNENNDYMERNSSQVILDSIRPKLNRKWLDEERANFNNLILKVKEIVEGVRLNKNVPIQEKIPKLRELIELLPQIYAYSNSFYMFSTKLEEEAIAKLTASISNELANDILLSASHAVEPTMLEKYQNDLKKIAQKVKSRSKFSNLQSLEEFIASDDSLRIDLNNLEQNYYFLSPISAEIRTKHSFIADLYQAITNPILSEKKIEIPKVVLGDCYVLSNTNYFKDECSSHIIPYVRYALKREWDELAKQIGLSYDEMQELMPEEVFAAVENNINLKKKAQNGLSGTLIIHEANKPRRVLCGQEAKELFESLVVTGSAKSTEDVTELSGRVGCPGLARGEVMIVRYPEDIKNFKEGMVLVAVYTAPEFVPAMKKAMAIITDTGGITCHAAIVARELQKPCVINTKNATSVLKNGDIVEVDANKGIVRKI